MTRSPVSLEGLTLGLAGGGGGGGPPQPPGLSQRNLACLRALVAAAVFLAGTLGPSWFAVLEALQNAGRLITYLPRVAPPNLVPWPRAQAALPVRRASVVRPRLKARWGLGNCNCSNRHNRWRIHFLRTRTLRACRLRCNDCLMRASCWMTRHFTISSARYAS